jgi:hypothetical protein
VIQSCYCNTVMTGTVDRQTDRHGWTHKVFFAYAKV